jgi:hypothetical protein
MDTADEFANPPVFLRRNFPTNITGSFFVGDWGWLVYEMDE